MMENREGIEKWGRIFPTEYDRIILRREECEGNTEGRMCNLAKLHDFSPTKPYFRKIEIPIKLRLARPDLGRHVSDHPKALIGTISPQATCVVHGVGQQLSDSIVSVRCNVSGENLWHGVAK